MDTATRKKRCLAVTQLGMPTNPKKTKLRDASSSSSRAAPYISDDLLFSHIFSSLPVKSLYKFRLVCRQWHSVLSALDNCFVLQQYLRQSSISCGLVYCNGDRRSIAFLPTFGEPIGVADPNLGLGGKYELKLLSSAHGLLCLSARSEEEDFLYVCNPATGEGHRVPQPFYYLWSYVGLAFNPSASADEYILVYPCIAVMLRSATMWSFWTFCSSTGQWTMHGKKIFYFYHQFPKKVVSARGVLYWHCDEVVIWFDLDENNADATLLPEGEPKASYGEELGVWEDRVTCTRINEDRVEVWMITETRKTWVMVFCMFVEVIIRRNQDIFSSYCYCILSRSWDSIWGRLRDGHKLLPLPYEGGGSLYLRIQHKEENKPREEVIFRYDMETKKAKEFKKSVLGNRSWRQPFFCYCNSLVPLN